MKVRYLFGIFLILAAAGPVSALEETEYFALFIGGKKIGHAVRSRVTAGEKVTTIQEVSMQVYRANAPVKLNTVETSIETTDGKPLGFKVVQDLGATTTIISGTVDELWIVNMTVTLMGKKQEKIFGWPSGAIMAEGLRLLQLEKGLKEGLEYSAKLFNPGNLQAIEFTIHIGPKQKVDLLGRVVALTEIKTAFKVPAGGEIVSTSYVDEGLRVQKSVAPMLGAQMEMIACAKEFALGENDVLELVDKMFLGSPEPLNNIESAKSIIYHLMPSDKAKMLTIPSSDNQSVEQLKEGGVIVTVRPVAPDGGVKFPYEGKDSNILEATKPTRFVQSDSNDIIELAKRAVGDTKDAAEAVKKIESFVSGYIENKGLSVGYASAAEVAASKAGDCTEFAVLTASMCRAIGIPARIVFGLVYVKAFAGKENVFGGHAWVEAYVGGKWVGLDATRTPKGFDASHITLAIGKGEPVDFFNLAATLGQFKIEKVTINRE
jgi:hypothetical protein